MLPNSYLGLMIKVNYKFKLFSVGSGMVGIVVIVLNICAMCIMFLVLPQKYYFVKEILFCKRNIILCGKRNYEKISINWAIRIRLQLYIGFFRQCKILNWLCRNYLKCFIINTILLSQNNHSIVVLKLEYGFNAFSAKTKASMPNIKCNFHSQNKQICWITSNSRRFKILDHFSMLPHSYFRLKL